MDDDRQPEADVRTDDVSTLAGDLVAAYVSNNRVPAADLPALIRTVHAALSRLAAALPAVVPEEAVEKPTAAQIRDSVTPDGIVSFVDGKTYKTMKRHLTTNGYDPQGYRQRFGLPADYPMVASNYAAQRSALAKSIGLGRPGGRPEPVPPAKATGRKRAA